MKLNSAMEEEDFPNRAKLNTYIYIYPSRFKNSEHIIGRPDTAHCTALVHSCKSQLNILNFRMAGDVESVLPKVDMNLL